MLRKCMLLLLPMSISAGLMACGSSDDSGPVSFRNDVAPIFTNNCAFSSCHGAGTPNGVILGGDAPAVRSSLVNVPASEIEGMNFVTPGDPSRSYLMHKVDGDHAQFSAQCSNEPNCGSTMPLGQPQLSRATRDTIRRWISDGAPDN